MSSIDIPPLGAPAESPASETATTDHKRIRASESRNLLVLAVFHIVQRIAWVFKTESVLMPAFLDTIAGAGWLRGCLPVLNRFGQSVPPLLMAEHLRHTARKKWPLLVTTLLMGVPFLMLSAIWLWLPDGRRSWLPAVFLLLYVIFFSLTGLNQMVFGTIQGKLIRPDRRGRLMSISGTLGAFTAIPCAWFLLSRWLKLPDGGFGYIFGFTGVGFVVAGLLTTALVEPADRTEGLKPKSNDHFQDAWRMLCRDRRFRCLAIVGMLCMSGQLLFPHYQALARDQLNAPNSDLMIWVVAQNAGAGLFSFMAGILADRFGNRLAVRLEIAILSVTPMLAICLADGLLPGGASFFWITFFLLGLTPITMKTLVNYTLEMSSQPEHPRYISTLKLCMAVPFVLSPLLGLLVDTVGFSSVFVAITCLIAAGGLLTFRLVEPRHELVRSPTGRSSEP